MQGLPKTPENSWVVAKATGQPTGYAASERDPRLDRSGQPITVAAELISWLKAHP